MKNKKCIKIFSLALALCAANPVQGAVVDQIGDRYIINVEEMNLTGDESLLDVLLSCPDVLSLDGRNVLGGDAFAAMYGSWIIRIDNLDYVLDNEAFLKNVKAREVDKIRVCHHPGVMKGCGGMGNVIDISLRRGDNGISGRVAAEGESYGGAKMWTSVLHQADRLRIFGIADGHAMRQKDDTGLKGHGSHEGVKLNVVYDFTPSDKLEVDISQSLFRNRKSGAGADYSRRMDSNLTYERVLSEAGAMMLVNMSFISENMSGDGYRNRVSVPFVIIESAFPFISHNLWVTAGMESGITVARNRLAGCAASRSRYEDGYVQLDWNVGKWGFMLGDRYRIIYYRQNELEQPYTFEHSVTNHAYTASVYHRFGAGNTLQATFARRYYNPDFEDFIVQGGAENSVMAGQIAGGKVYTPDYRERVAYVSEMKYTYSKPDFTLGSMVKNIHQGLAGGGHDNTLGVGATAFWHRGALRLTAGANWYWQKTSFADGSVRHDRFATMKLAPQVALGNGWRFTSLLLYNTRRDNAPLADVAANMYAQVEVQKKLGRKWMLETRFHDIAGQHTGNRAATLGITYYWGKS